MKILCALFFLMFTGYAFGGIVQHWEMPDGTDLGTYKELIGPDNSTFTIGMTGTVSGNNFMVVKKDNNTTVCLYCGPTANQTCSRSTTKIRVTNPSYYYETHVSYPGNSDIGAMAVDVYLACVNSQWYYGYRLNPYWQDSTTVTGGICYTGRSCVIGGNNCNITDTCTTPTHCNPGYYYTGSTCAPCSDLGVAGASSYLHNRTEGMGACYLYLNTDYTDNSGTFNYIDNNQGKYCVSEYGAKACCAN